MCQKGKVMPMKSGHSVQLGQGILPTTQGMIMHTFEAEKDKTQNENGLYTEGPKQ
jgi:hypothetical protein